MSFLGLKRQKLLRQARKGVKKLERLKINDIMTDYVVTIPPEKSVTEAAAVMIGEDVSALVVEQENKPIGILTERDFISKVPLSSKVFKLKVKNIMSCSFSGEKKSATCAVENVHPEGSVTNAQKHLEEKHIRKLVVTNEEGLVAGIITQTDLSKALYNNLKVVAHLTGVPFTVEEVMSKKIISVPRSSSFAKAKQTMTKHNLSALPVTRKKEYEGIFTEYDVVMQFYDAGGRLDIKSVPEIMKTPLKVIPAELNIFDANTIMIFQKVRRLLVVKNKKVVGIITQTDLVKACYRYVAVLAKKLEENASSISENNLQVLRRKENIISEYAGEHLRAYTMR